MEPRLSLWTPERIESWVADLDFYGYVPREGDTVLDVGAGTGWATRMYSKLVGKSGRVVSIEANPTTFRCLARMCSENRLENVTLIHSAVADREGEILIADSPEHEANSVVGTSSGVRVPCTTLDEVFRSHGLSRVDFLKMNIEGAEKLAITGMEQMVKKTLNVCISCHDFLADEGGANELRTKADVVAFLNQHGFVLSLRESDGRCTVRNFVYGASGALAAGSHRSSGLDSAQA